MAWTYTARMARAIAKLTDKGRLDDDGIFVYRRARFFDKYAFRVSLPMDFSQWVNFDEHLAEFKTVFEPMGAHIVAVKSTFDIYVYGNDPAILTWLIAHPAVNINSLIQTDPASWGQKLPKSKKNTGKFFGEYRFRVRMRLSHWGVKPENIAQLDELEIDYKLFLRTFHHAADNVRRGAKMSPESMVRDTFVYVKKVNEVLVLKLLLADQISEVTERA